MLENDIMLYIDPLSLSNPLNGKFDDYVLNTYVGKFIIFCYWIILIIASSFSILKHTFYISNVSNLAVPI
jgi:hypothetical protein